MNIIDKYLSSDFLAAFLLTLLVITFVMCLGVVVRAIDLMARGVSGLFILRIFVYNIPFIMTFSIPMSVLTTVLLQFGRMSFDGEIVALKASGLSMWQVVSPIVLLSIMLSVLCVYLSGTLAPRSRFAQRQVLVDLGVEEPANLIEEGRFVKDFPGLMIYVAKKEHDRVFDVVVYKLNEAGNIERSVRARWGTVHADRTNRVLQVDLYDVRLEQQDEEDPMNPSKTRTMNAAHYPVRLDFTELMRRGNVTKKKSDFTYPELLWTVRHIREAYPKLPPAELASQRMNLVVEANKRLGLSVSCFAFTLLGIPLAMKSRRRESSVGIGISLLLVFCFYFFIILAESLVGSPRWRPDLIIWIPIVFAECLGFILIQRTN